MSAITVAVAQYEASRDVAANTKASTTLIGEASANSQLVVLPENAMYSDPGKEAPDVHYAEPLDGGFVTAVKDAAKTHSVHVLVGFTEDNGTDRPFNTLVHVTPGGELDGVYRKIHLYDAFGYKESDKVTPAEIDSPLVFTIGGVTIGALTCYDLRFPEIFRWVADRGVDLVALPAAWVAGPAKEFHWETLIRARAIENTVYFAGCGQTGPSCAGQSMIVDPMGVVVANAGESAMAIATATIMTERVAQVRATNPSLINRRFTVSPGAPQ
ncbi:carbon-nitrogen hydrolase family protein [Saxibacter everestensis]|uniref:Carbon-nitrogen hydrolase family protein n=1 Tax=Saxibacter everestensis TaxID=2909229 RepID=A0ABY8QRC3_9MICO|nr:carbon-nitrogen hydrolase family protein [Brevibacteriaceae bacterium ZFBP1038]